MSARAGLRLELTLAAVLLAACAGWTLWRAGQEASLWQDELYSLAVATQPAGRVVALAARDVHPPAYYLALAGWLAAGRAAGLDPGVLWARGLHVAFWGLVVAAVWLVTRRRVGREAAPLLAVAVAVGAPAARWALELRGGAVVFGASTVALLLVVADLAERAGRTGRRAAWWGAYALLAAAAAWSHLLAVPLFALLGLGWAVLAWRRAPAGERLRRLGPGALAHAAAALLILPWAAAAFGQLGALERSGTGWMTAPTWPHLTAVFTYWLPFGRLFDPAAAPAALRLLGLASVVVPATALAWKVGRAGPPRASREDAAALGARATRDLMALGLGVAALFVAVLWGLARLGVAPVFHGPRYPLLAGGLWSLGLGAAAWLAAGSRVKARVPAAWACIAPWVLCGLVGQLVLGLDEPRRGLARAGGELAAAAAGRQVFAFPSELLPFYRRTLSPYGPRPIEELPCAMASGSADEATVLDLDPWPALDGPRDRLVARSLRPGGIARSVERSRLPPGDPLVTIHLLRDLDRDALAALCARGWRPAGLDPPAAAVAVARPADQARADGWSRLEIAPDLGHGRWGSAGVTVLRLPGPVPAGRYRLHLAGSRHPYPRARERLRVVPPEGPPTARELGPGPFEVTVPVELTRTYDELRVEVHHPVWRPSETLGTGDRRRLTFYFRGAWLELVP